MWSQSEFFWSLQYIRLKVYRNDPGFLDRQVLANSADPDQSDQGLHCFQFHLNLLVHYSMIKPPCSNLKVITANCLVVRIFWIFTVYTFPHELCHEKICFCHMRTTKAQISMRICAVWSAHLLFAAYIV